MKKFIQLSKAWYGSANLKKDTVDEISIEVDGVLSVVFIWIKLPKMTAIKMEVFDESWKVFSKVPELFEELSNLEEKSTISVEEFVKLLKRHGFKDVTEQTKTPSGLAKVKNKKYKIDPMVDSLYLDPEIDIFDHIKSVNPKNKSVWDSQIYLNHEMFVHLSSEIVQEITGYSHSSEVLDTAPESVLKTFGKISSSTMESSDFYKGDYYEDVKTGFKETIDQELGNGSFLKLKSFGKIYDFLVKRGYTKTEKELELYLKNSLKFRSFCKELTTRYSG